MNVTQSLRKDFSWALSGNLVYSSCQWMVLIVLAHLGSPEQVGEYALGLAISAPILLFCNFQLRALVLSDVQHRHAFEEYLGFRLITLLIAIIVLIVVLGVSGYSSHLGGIVLLVGVAQALEILSDFYYGVMQGHGRMDRVSRSLMIKGPLALTALGISMYVGRSVFWALLALITARLAVVLIYDSSLSYRRDLDSEITETNRPRCSRHMMASLLRMSVPLGAISMLVSLNASVVPYFIAGELSKHALGIFSALYSLQNAGSLVMAALGQSAFVSLARAYSFNDRSRFTSLLLHLRYVAVGLGCVGIVVSIFLGQAGLGLLFKPEYGSHVGVFIRLMMAAGIAYLGSCQGYALTAMQTLTPQIPVLLITTLATVAACWVCIPGRGLNGAAEACIISASVQLAGSALVLSRETRLKFLRPGCITTAGDRSGVPANQVSP
jgi:O-antigen/teichoic acid export membrane protein